MMMAQMAEKNKKKKNLINSILDEITKYGMFIVLGFVVFTVLIVLRMDKIQQKRLQSVHEKSEEETKKDIWHEEFY